MKKLMAVVGNPIYLRAFHGYSTMFWIPFTILAFFLGWLESVVFVSFVSMIALFLGSFSSWQASRTEVAQNEMNETKEDKRFKLHKRRPSPNVSRQLRMKRHSRLQHASGDGISRKTTNLSV
jgi:membrane protein implicated in regulation of membrane protease activity